MKRFLLLGILMLTYGFGFSQVINKPTRDVLVCLGGELSVKFKIDETSGTFSGGSHFVVQLSDKDGIFGATPTVLEQSLGQGTNIDYVSGETNYSGIFIFDATERGTEYRVRVYSSDDIYSVQSGFIQGVENEQVVVSIENDDPTEFCEGDQIVLLSNLSSGTNVWYKDGGVVGVGMSFPVTQTGDYYVENQIGNSCSSISATISVIVSEIPTSNIIEPDTDICFPDSFTFHADISDASLDNPYYEWYLESDQNNILHEGGIGLGDAFTTATPGVYMVVTVNQGQNGGGCPTPSSSVELRVHDFEAVIEEVGPLKICSGVDVTLTSEEKNTAYTYNWYLGGVLQSPGSGVGKFTYSFTATELLSGDYTLEILSPVPGCNKTSSILNITIKDSPPNFAIIEGDQKGCNGSDITLTSDFTDLGYVYQWYYGPNPAPGTSNLPTYDLVLKASTEGMYRLDISFGDNCTVSETVIVTLVDAPTSVIDKHPEAIECEGDVAVLTALSVGDLLTYEWFKDGNIQVGETNSTYNATASGRYNLRTTSDGTCSTMSLDMQVIISPKAIPIITSVSGLFTDCSIITLDATSSDLKISELVKPEDAARVEYKWYDENDIYISSGEQLEVSVSGSHVYKLEALNYGVCSGVAAEVVVTITPYESVIIGSNGEDLVTECIGTVFSLESEDKDASFTYAWYKGSVVSGSEIGTDNKLDLTGLATDAGDYILVVDGYNCSKESTPFTVVMVKTPIALIEDDGSGFSGCSDVLLKSESTELEAPTTYQWYKGGLAIDGATLDTYLATESGEYTLEVFNKNTCSTISSLVDVTITPYESEIVTIGGETSLTECIDGTIFSLESKDTDVNFTYAWYKGSVVSGSEIGANSTLDLKRIATDAGDYILVVDGYNCSKESFPFNVTMVKTPVALIKDDGSDFSGCSDVLLESESTELEAPTTYQWYKGGVAINGATSDTYLATETDEYALEVFNKNTCSTISTPVDVKIDDLTAEIELGKTNECIGNDIILKATTNDESLYTYQWLEIVGGIENDILGANSSTYIVIADVAKEKTYKVKVKSIQSGCEKTSKVAVTVIIKNKPVAEIEYKNGVSEGCKGDFVILRSGETIDPDYTYVWKKDDGTTVGTGTELVVELLNEIDVAYTLSIIYGSCFKESLPAKVHMIKTPTSIVAPSEDQIVCDDVEVILDGNQSVDLEIPAYQWYVSHDDGANYSVISGAVSVTYKIDETGWYKLQITNNGNCDDFSDAVYVEFIPTLIAKISPNVDQNVCENVTFDASKSDNIIPGVTTYKWYRVVDGVETEIPFANDQTYNAKIEADYFFEAYNGSCGTRSEVVNVTLTQFEHEIEEFPSAKECIGHDIVLHSINSDEANYQFTWFKEGSADIIGVGPVYTVTGEKDNSGFYFVEVSEKGTLCTKPSELVEVIIKDIPSSTINLGTGTNCEGEIINITSHETDLDYDYTWYYNDVEVVEGGNYANVDTPTLSVTMFHETEGEYKVKVSIGSCGGNKSLPVTLVMDDIDPILDFDPGLVLCKDGFVTLTTTTTPLDVSSKYEWYVNGSLIYGENEVQLKVSKAGLYKSKAYHEGTLCSQFTDEVEVVSVTNMGVVKDTIYANPGETVTFEAFGGDSYVWFDSRGNIIQTGGDKLLVPDVEGNIAYQVKISNGYCDEIFDLLIISGEITADDIQNIITPNGDGHNDVWTLPPGFVNSGDEVILLNRQGSIVYKSTNYRDDWGGTLNDGPALPAATYYYVIKRLDKEPVMGSITIFR